MPSTHHRVRRIIQAVVLTALFASCQINCPFDSDDDADRAPPRRESPPERSGGCGGFRAPEADAGANEAQRGPGNGDTGVALGLGDIAVAPDGAYFLAQHDDGLIHVELVNGNARWIPSIEHPERLAFSPDGTTVFVIEGDGERLVAVDLTATETIWSRPVDGELGFSAAGEFIWMPLLQVTPSGDAVVLQGNFTVEVVDAGTGGLLHSLTTAGPIRDVDLITDAVFVAERESWDVNDTPTSRLHTISLVDGSTSVLEVPNCASEVVVAPDGVTALMAPVDCAPPSNAVSYDPISLIDLAGGGFVRNLPGFGPVQITPDGSTAVGFLDMNDVDEALFDDPSDLPPPGSARYHLLLVDLATLELTTVELGSVLPRYTLTPDGAVLLIDSDFFGNGSQLRILDLLTLELLDVDHTGIRLDNFVITSDSAWVYALWQGLWEVHIASATAAWVGLHFEPSNLNITPDDARLLLRQDGSTLHLWRRDLRQISLTIDLVEALAGTRPPGEATVVGP